jgi:hypothetical protein
MANLAETCSVYICNKEKESEKLTKLHVEGKIILKATLDKVFKSSRTVPYKSALPLIGIE